MTIADILRAELDAQGKSLNALARTAGLSPGRVHAILSGETPNPGVLTVRAVLDAMGRSLGWLERQMKA